MNIGYYFWGHLSDKVSAETKNTPDGNAWYSSCIIEELLNQNHRVWMMGIDRDKNDYNSFKNSIFDSFEKSLRLRAFLETDRLNWTSNWKSMFYPDLDVLLLEWRFPIPGRNIISGHPELMPPDLDLLMQKQLLNHYKKTSARIVIFDLDYKLTKEDEEQLLKDFEDRVRIFETSINPKTNIVPRVSVQIPFWINRATLPETKENNYAKQMVYVGSRYERDDIINKYVVPFSRKHPFTVWFYGNWRNYPDKYDQLYNELNWRDIQYHHRVGHVDFRQIYQDAVCCPLLAKKSYLENGFMTARIQEALYFGTIPVGFEEHSGISKYLPSELIVNDDVDRIESVLKWLTSLDKQEKDNLRKKVWNNLSFMDVSVFVNQLLGN